MFTIAGHKRRTGSSSASSGSLLAEAGYNRQTKLVVKRADGKELHRKMTLVNFDTDLQGLVSTLQFSLQSSPGEPLLPLDKLSYRAMPCSDVSKSSWVGEQTSKGGGALVLLDEHTFNPETFLPMKKVCLFAVVRADQDSGGDGKEDETVNDENDRRLSNGSAPSTAAAAAAAAGLAPSSPPIKAPGMRVTRSRPSSPDTMLSKRPTVPVRRGEAAAGASGGHRSDGGGSRRSFESGRESSWDPSVCDGVEGQQSMSSAGWDGITPRASSVAEQDRGNGQVAGESRASSDGDGVCGDMLAIPGPGLKSKLFRTISLLPSRPSVGVGHDEEENDGSASHGDGGGDGSIITPEDSVDDSSVCTATSTNSSGSGSVRRKHLAVRDHRRGPNGDTKKRGGGGSGRGPGRGRGSDRRAVTGSSGSGSGREASARKEPIPRQQQQQQLVSPARGQRQPPRGQNPLVSPRKAVVPAVWTPACGSAGNVSTAWPPPPLPPVSPPPGGSPRPMSPRVTTVDRRKATAAGATTKPSMLPAEAKNVTVAATATVSKLPITTTSLTTPVKRKPKLPVRPGPPAMATSAMDKSSKQPNVPMRPGVSGASARGGPPPPAAAVTTTPKAAAARRSGAESYLSPTAASLSQSRSPRPKPGRPKPSSHPKAEEGVEEEGEAKTPRVSTVFSWERELRKGGSFRTGTAKIPTKKAAGFTDAFSPTRGGLVGKARGAWRQGMKGAGGGGTGGGGNGGGGNGGGGNGGSGNGGGGNGGGGSGGVVVNGGGGGGRVGKALFGDNGDGDGDGRWEDGADGRPSIGTWNKTQDYLQILKELSGKDEEELEWLAVAKKGNGVYKSEKRRESAETEYHRLLCEESMHQDGLKLLHDRRLEKALKAVAVFGNELKRLNEIHTELAGQEHDLDAEDEDSSDEESAAERAAAADSAPIGWREQKARLVDARCEAEAKVGDCLEEIGKVKRRLKAVVEVLRQEVAGRGGGGGGATGTAVIGAGKALQTIVGVATDVCSVRDDAAPDRAVSGLRSLDRAAASVREELIKSRAGAQAALGRMEKWRQRKEALPEYEKEMADQERAWFEREKDANNRALKRMRALIPVGVTGLTVTQLEKRVIKNGSLYPRELALRLKTNRLLHWTVEHPDDITRANFLRGDHAHFFTNLDKYDLVEMRAITACLPERFVVDGDGRKAAWRAGFLQRIQAMVSQERGDTVSGGWDPDAGARRTVTLPPLSVEQVRRPEYFYPTRAEAEQRLEKLRERERRLDAKRAALEKIKDVSLPEARKEYANVLEDTRHPANKELYSAEDLRRARDEAKAEADGLAKEAKRMEGEVATAERAMREAPYTVESLEAEIGATTVLLQKRAAAAQAAAEKRRALLAAEREKRWEKKGRDAEQAREKSGGEGGKEGEEEVRVVRNGTENGKLHEVEVTASDATIDDDTAAAAATAAVASASAATQIRGSGESDDESTGIPGDGGGSRDKAGSPLSSSASGREEKKMLPLVLDGVLGGNGKPVRIEGPFDSEPELQSRLADKSSSLKFVTAEEDARMRREELTKAMAAREPLPEERRSLSAGAVAGGESERVDPATSDSSTGETAGATAEAVTAETAAAEAAAAASGGDQGKEGEAAAVLAATREGDEGRNAGATGGGTGASRIKAFGAILEKTLSKNMMFSSARAAVAGGSGSGGGLPTSPRVAAGVVSGDESGAAGSGSGTRKLLSPPAPGSGHRDARTSHGDSGIPKILAKTPPCKPKSKFFKSIRGNTGAQGSGESNSSPSSDGGQLKSLLVSSSSPQPPPQIRLGLLAQIRQKSAGAGLAGANGDSTRRALPPLPPPAMGGLLAQIRARADKVKGGGNSGEEIREGGEEEAVARENKSGTDYSSVCAAGGTAPAPATVEDPVAALETAVAPLPSPPPPALPMPLLKPRSLFGQAAASAFRMGATAGAPPDFLAELREKATAKAVLRQPAGGDDQ